MDLSNTNWTLGEIVRLPRQTSPINKSYEYLMFSRYICIREDTKRKRGILLKVLGKATREDIIIKGGSPFCKDDYYEGLYSDTYYSFRFPSVNELKEVLDILKNDESLLEVFEKAQMHINPNSTFWVRETDRRLFFIKELQYYDSRLDQPNPSSNNETHYRLTIVYFHNSQLFW